MSEESTLKAQLRALESELAQLRTAHEAAQQELAEAHQRHRSLEALYSTLLEAVNGQQAEALPEVRLTIEGDFSSQRIAELERELEEYRSGVNASVDRRVREIVREYTALGEEEEQSWGEAPPSQHHYSISLRQAVPCAHCGQGQMEQLAEQLEEARSDNLILAEQLSKSQQIVDSLQRENDLLSRAGGSAVSKSTRQSQMREIGNLISAISNRKAREEEERGSRGSRQWPVKDSASLFSIKNGINRPRRQPLFE